jgi:hypothetical protein
MGTAVVAGVFALVLAVLSWLLTNGGRRSRLLGRIERQVAVLKDLPEGHAARQGIDEALLRDVAELSQMGAAPVSDGVSRLLRWLAGVSGVLATMSLLVSIYFLVQLLQRAP